MMRAHTPPFTRKDMTTKLLMPFYTLVFSELRAPPSYNPNTGAPNDKQKNPSAGKHLHLPSRIKPLTFHGSRSSGKAPTHNVLVSQLLLLLLILLQFTTTWTSKVGKVIANHRRSHDSTYCGAVRAIFPVFTLTTTCLHG